MKRLDNFLRAFRRSPRREFSDSLYRRISGKKTASDAFRQIAVWGLMGMLVFTSFSSTLFNHAASGANAPLSAQVEVEVSRQQRHNPALVAEHGLQPAEFTPTPDSYDRLGPFDKPKSETFLVNEESGLIAMAMLAERQ